MQNGLRSTQIATKKLGNAYIFACVVLLNARFLEPGKISFVAEKPIVIGNINNNRFPINEIKAILSNLVKTEICDNIIGALWTKILINSMSNALDTMTGLKLSQYKKYIGIRKIGVKILREAFSVANKAEITLMPLPGIPLKLFKVIIRLPIGISSFFLGLALSSSKDKEIITSTLQSIKRGKTTEIDYLNGEIVELGRKMNLPTPYNSKVVELVHQIENTKRFFSPDELVSIFNSIGK
jgi:2-dehydropantoate 2-reductase